MASPSFVVVLEADVSHSPGQLSKYKSPFHLIASEIHALRVSGALPKLPKITAAEIADKSKDDILLKVITALQILWFILQVVVRVSRRMGISQLEIAVSGFGVCAIMTYFLLIPKPKSVDIPLTIMVFDGHIPIEEAKYEILSRRDLETYGRSFLAPEKRLNYSLNHDFDHLGDKIPDDAIPNDSGPALLLHAGLAMGSFIFGAVHITGWSLVFPSPLEQTLWRVASITTTVCLLVMYCPLVVFWVSGTSSYEAQSRLWPHLLKIWHIGCGVLYFVARSFLLVEIFRTIFYLPQDAFVTTWASDIPHVA